MKHEDSIKIEEISLTNEELSKVLNYIKHELGYQDPSLICHAINNRLNHLNIKPQQDKLQKHNILHDRTESESPPPKPMEIYPSRKTKWIKNISAQEQKIKYEEQKFIANCFCQHGINYHYITKFYPNMEPKTYRCYVEAINNQAVNEIVDFLRYQCNVQIERLNRDQKRSIRTQLTKIREWLGNRDNDQLQTFYRFIHRHYNKSLQIKFEDALKLYKTIIQIIKSPYVNVLEAEEVVRRKDNKQIIGQTLSVEQEKALVILLIKYKDLHKVSDGLCQTYGYDLKWSFHSVKMKIKELVNNAINKLLNCLRKKDKSIYEHYFDEKKREALNLSEQLDIKIKLLSFYLDKKTNYMKIKEIIGSLTSFYNSFPENSSELSLPKIQQTISSFYECKTEEVSEFKIEYEQKNEWVDEQIQTKSEMGNEKKNVEIKKIKEGLLEGIKQNTKGYIKTQDVKEEGNARE